jgi:hypothetical protein
MQQEKSVSRKKFISWGVVMTSLMAVPTFLFLKKKKDPQLQTKKMLTRDGRLVEIDVTKLSASKKKIKDEEIHTWIKNKKTI